jgi:chromosomal replication initiator protein
MEGEDLQTLDAGPRLDMNPITWDRCLRALESELPERQFNTWVRPLQAVELPGALKLLAPNRFAVDWVRANLLPRLALLVADGAATNARAIIVEVGSRSVASDPPITNKIAGVGPACPARLLVRSRLQENFSFEAFVEGKGNQLAKRAATQVADSPGRAYNPLFICGGVGLGKTHLVHAIAHRMRERNSQARIAYVHSERFVGDMVSALQRNAMNDFKTAYRSLDALLIDDVQFFGGKDRSQEELFHTFNELFEGQRQIVLTSDRYPMELSGVEDRLKSRFGCGLIAAIAPPDPMTCAAILLSKAQHAGVDLPGAVVSFLGARAWSNVRELEGALHRLIAHSRFGGEAITVELTQLILQDLFASRTKLQTIEHVQKMVADYFSVSVPELLSKRRCRSVVRPRQIAMALAKEVTSHSLPEIASAFGGRDHTTVMHACKRVDELRASDEVLKNAYSCLLRSLAA